MASASVPATEKMKGLPAAAGGTCHCDEASSSTLPLPRQREGKAIMQEAPEVEVSVVRVNIGAARRAMNVRLFAVGLFLSALLVNPRQLIVVLRRVWKVRGDLSARVVAERRYILEFSEEGDRQNAIRGGPWRYSGDAFLVEPFDGLGDPSEVVFPTIPMWVQFRNIPFYLLTRELGEALRRRVGGLLRVDTNSHGDINDKFIRARVLLPLQRALQRSIRVEDTVTDETATSVIRYERLPNFCLYCGFIGHMEHNCNLRAEHQEIRFSTELRVPPVIPEDPRSWFLPTTTGQSLRQHRAALPWRAGNNDTDNNRRLRILPPSTVEQVAKAVANLKVNGEEEGQASGAPSEGVAVASQEEDNTNKPEDIAMKKGGSWKRINREEVENQDKNKGGSELANTMTGVVRPRPSEPEPGEEREAKRVVYRGPTLSECLGTEELHQLRAEEENRVLGKWVQPSLEESSDPKEPLSEEYVPFSVLVNGKKEKDKIVENAGREKGKNKEKEGTAEEEEGDADKEATSPGAAGHLAGAKERACQKP